MFRTPDGKSKPGMVNLKVNFLRGKQKELKNLGNIGRCRLLRLCLPGSGSEASDRCGRPVRDGLLLETRAQRGVCSAGRVRGWKNSTWTWR